MLHSSDEFFDRFWENRDLDPESKKYLLKVLFTNAYSQGKIDAYEGETDDDAA